jgi:hypothetical protein
MVWLYFGEVSGKRKDEADKNFSNITHYSYFGAFRSDVSNVGPNSAMLTKKGQLTDIGSWYMGGAATNNIPSGAAQLTSSILMWWTFAMVMLIGIFN